MVDVDADPALEAKYDELVPVLLHGDTELCHYFLDEAKVREYLAGIAKITGLQNRKGARKRPF